MAERISIITYKVCPCELKTAFNGFILNSVLQRQEKYKNLELIVKSQKLDMDMIIIMSVPGIGEKRIKRLMNAGLCKPIDILMEDNFRLSGILKMRVERIQQMKKDISEVLN